MMIDFVSNSDYTIFYPPIELHISNIIVQIMHSSPIGICYGFLRIYKVL